jgi:hypothetical protein
MEKAFNQGYKEAIETLPFIPNRNNNLLLLSNTLIEETDIDEVIGAQFLIEYYNSYYKSVEDTDFSAESIANKKLKSVKKLIELGAKTFEVKNLMDLFNNLKLQDSLKVENNFKVIDFIYKKAMSEHAASLWKKYIPDIAFIFNQNGELCSPSKPIYFPIDNFETRLNQNFDFVHSEVLKKINLDIDIKDWLNQVGVTKPTPKNIIEKTIDIPFLISFDYKNMNKVMRVIKEKKLDIVTQTMELGEDSGIALGKIEIKTRKKNAEFIFDIFDNLFEIEIKRL